MNPSKRNPNESKWIERHKHEAIISQYKTKVQSIISDYDAKIAIQAQRINILMDTIRQQKDIIDSFVLNRGPNELNVIEDEMHLESTASVNENVKEVATHDNQSELSEHNSEFSLAQCEDTTEAPNHDAKDAILLAINIQPNVSRTFECNLCHKSLLSKRVLTVSIDR